MNDPGIRENIHKEFWFKYGTKRPPNIENI
jgi:hypothetical protein